ncbi:hypothetical protein TNCV_4688421 [Trichonephila clavipes]|nr:hypothetical protein TNCV_4688421 [Trichonephila clavipes]
MIKVLRNACPTETKDDPHTVTPCEIAVCRSTINAEDRTAGRSLTCIGSVVVLGEYPIPYHSATAACKRLSGRRLLRKSSPMVSLDGMMFKWR